MLSPGDKVNEYEIVAPLGSGGMAMLYLARRRGVGGFSRLVTLKLVHQHLREDEGIIQRFLDEARICACVAHPNVVHVEEVGQCDGSYFIAMEYVHGVSLAELLARLSERRLRMHPKLCVWVTAQIAEALHAAHEATGECGVPLDIVHRDVSPQNVLIAHTGHVKLIDFGIAKTDDRSGGRLVVGKLRYMSPEQLQLERADRRTDVYALGVMLWEMLAGRGLLRCQRIDDERDWATRTSPPAPSKYTSRATPQLDAVVLTAIACDPKQRYQNALQLRAALLRADRSALRVDPPMVAGLMRSMLGDELDRRRASWPREIIGVLDAETEVVTAQSWNLEDLTLKNVSSPRLGEINSAPPTAAEPKPDEDDPTLVASPRVLAASARSSAALPQSAIDTHRLPPSVVQLFEPLVDSPRSFTAAIVGVAIVVGGLLGWYRASAARTAMAESTQPATLEYLQRGTALTARAQDTALGVPNDDGGNLKDAAIANDPEDVARANRSPRKDAARAAVHRVSAPRPTKLSKPAAISSKTKLSSSRKERAHPR